MKEFAYEQPTARVVFGTDLIATLPNELERLGANRAVVVGTPSQRRSVEAAAAALGSGAVGTFVEAATHIPIDVARRAWKIATDLEADACVAIGGGNAIGVAKGIAFETGIPIVAMPTTYSGSEATPIYGFTEEGTKRVGKDMKTLPKVVLYDAALAAGLPPEVSGPSGMNAMAHCVVGLYAPDATPISTLFAAEGIRALARSLPIVVTDPGNLGGRADVFYGSWLAGSMLRMVSVSLHYKLCHVLGGTFNLGHADVHTVILPHAVAFTCDAAPEATKIAAEALGANDAAQGLYDLIRNIGAPTSLEEIGMLSGGIEKAVEMTLDPPPYSPRPVDAHGIRQLIEDAYHGRRPR